MKFLALISLLLSAALPGICSADPAPAAAHHAAADELAKSGGTMLHVGGHFGDVAIYRPAGTAKRVVLFVSGDGGWHLGVLGMARHLADEGALVVGIDVQHYLGAIAQANHKNCLSLAVDFELLSHDVQKLLKLPDYLPTVLVGYSSGATIVYAVMAEAPPGTFGGAMSLGFCADQDFRSVPLCPGSGLHYAPNKHGDYVLDPAPKLQEPWIALQGQIDQVCAPAPVDAFAAQIPRAQVIQLPHVGHGFGVERNWLPQFRQAYLQLAAVTPAAHPAALTPVAGSPAAGIAGLPLVELPVSAGSGNRLAVVISGDGGWAGLDRSIGEQFVAHGVPVVGMDSLRYFWHERTPEETARDVAAIVTHYLELWHRERVDLVGYSFGADVLPLVVNRLPAALAAKIATVTLVEPSDSATFEIHVSDWLPGVTTPGVPTAPEIARLKPAPLCLYGGGDEHTICLKLPAKDAAQIGKGHHLGGDAESIVRLILQRG